MRDLSNCVSKFLPTPSHGGRHVSDAFNFNQLEFLPTPSHGGRLCLTPIAATALMDFYPRPHMEGDACRLEILSWVRFLPTPSHGGRR